MLCTAPVRAFSLPLPVFLAGGVGGSALQIFAAPAKSSLGRSLGTITSRDGSARSPSGPGHLILRAGLSVDRAWLPSFSLVCADLLLANL